MSKTVGARIRQAREAKGWTQRALAEAIGKSLQTVWRYEHGEQSIPLSVLERVAHQLGVTVASLHCDPPASTGTEG